MASVLVQCNKLRINGLDAAVVLDAESTDAITLNRAWVESVLARLASLESRLESVEALAPVPGPQGEPGPQVGPSRLLSLLHAPRGSSSVDYY